MSTQINQFSTARGELQFTQFCGPNGLMLQISQGTGIGADTPGFIQLSPSEIVKTVTTMMEWVKSECDRKAKKLRAEINVHRDMENTVFAEAAKCERFIADLQIPEFCVSLLEKTSK